MIDPNLFKEPFSLETLAKQQHHPEAAWWFLPDHFPEDVRVLHYLVSHKGESDIHLGKIDFLANIVNATLSEAQAIDGGNYYRFVYVTVDQG